MKNLHFGIKRVLVLRYSIDVYDKDFISKIELAQNLVE